MRGEAGAERQQGAAAAMAGRDKSSFAVTCSLLSQYLKEKKGAGLLSLGIAPPPAGEGVFRPPTTLNLLSALDDAPAAEPRDAATKATAEPRPRTADSVELVSPKEKACSTEPPAVLVTPTNQQNGENAREEAEEPAQPLTIFYGGKVVVFDNFPATKVKDLLQMVNGGHGGDKATSSNAAPHSLPTPSHNLSDMPIARRNSLHRFLEKRKSRIIAKAPYQVDTSVEASKASKQQATGEKSWLGFGQQATVKQEI